MYCAQVTRLSENAAARAVGRKNVASKVQRLRHCLDRKQVKAAQSARIAGISQCRLDRQEVREIRALGQQVGLSDWEYTRGIEE